jgi:hypothetical protein
MVTLGRRWFPTLPITLRGDTADRILELGLTGQEQQVALIPPFPLDAVLHDPPPPRDAHTIGRPRVVGLRPGSLEQVLVDPNTTGQGVTLCCSGQGERPREMCTGTALWYRAGFDPLPLRWVLTRDPQGKRPPKALCSTHQTLTAEQIVRAFLPEGSMPIAHTAWDHKHAATFHDVLAEVRRHFWRICSFSTAPSILMWFESLVRLLTTLPGLSATE